MPIYTYSCLNLNCDNVTTEMKKIDERDVLPVCEICDCYMRRQIDRPGLVWAPTAGGMR